ncbi:MAG: dehydrogenase, partial [Candidatus Aenigmarchaeota archaeon]|nr:dehydrogenase [Candidatus Aenigmarchaeota archaeon]
LGPYIVILALVSSVYSAFVAMNQKDLKKMIAYSSVTHMGLVLLGIASLNQIALAGAIYEMVAHGLISALMFTLAGMIHHSYGTRDVDKLSGLAIGTPRIGWILVIGSLAAFGLPTFAGFVAEFMILIGSYLALGAMVLPALLAILVTAAYFLWMMQKVIFSESHSHGHDIGFSELLPIGMILFFIVLLGVYPPILLNISNALSINVFG